MDPNGFLKHLQSDLENKSDPKVKAWWEKYVKGASFRGVKMAEIRKSVHQWRKKYSIDNTDPLTQFDLSLGLLLQDFTEDKLAGVLYLQEHLIKNQLVPWRIQVEKYPSLFENGHLADWNIVDWFCVKVMGPLADQQKKEVFEVISTWKNSETIWQRRASVVSFVNHAKKGNDFYQGFFDDLLNTIDHILDSKERFIQTGSGWVLRELSVAEPDKIYSFLLRNQDRFTGEGLRYASEKLTAAQKKSLKSGSKS